MDKNKKPKVLNMNFDISPNGRKFKKTDYIILFPLLIPIFISLKLSPNYFPGGIGYLLLTLIILTIYSNLRRIYIKNGYLILGIIIVFCILAYSLYFFIERGVILNYVLFVQ